MGAGWKAASKVGRAPLFVVSEQHAERWSAGPIAVCDVLLAMRECVIGKRPLTRIPRLLAIGRLRRAAQLGTGVQLRGRLRIDGPGRVEIGDECVIDGDNVIRTGDASSVVRIGPGCHLNGASFDTGGEVVLGRGVQVHGPIVIDGPGRVVVGDGCHVNQSSGWNAIHAVRAESTVTIGRECFLNGIDVFATEDVTIGDRCIIGNCSFMTTDFHSTDPDRWSPGARVRTGPIVVGSNVWIAARTVITKGVTIGADSVVSIGTIVREDVPSGVIVSSHEQRVVKELAGPAVDPFAWATWWTRSDEGV